MLLNIFRVKEFLNKETIYNVTKIFQYDDTYLSISYEDGGKTLSLLWVRLQASPIVALAMKKHKTS